MLSQAHSLRAVTPKRAASGAEVAADDGGRHQSRVSQVSPPGQPFWLPKLLRGHQMLSHQSPSRQLVLPRPHQLPQRLTLT